MHATVDARRFADELQMSFGQRGYNRILRQLLLLTCTLPLMPVGSQMSRRCLLDNVTAIAFCVAC